MQYGFFDQPNHEYVITNPKTPVKWINYIGTLNFGGFVDHTGGAIICRQDPALNRITKYISQNPDSDFKGETLYIRIHTENGYKIFSPFYVPTLHQLTSYECRVGLGYSIITSTYQDVRCSVTIFVPKDKQVEIREIRITNQGTKPLIIDIIPVVEYTHFDALKQLTNADWVPQTMQSKAIQDGDSTILVQYPFMNKDRQINYFTANLPCSSYETDRFHFLGNQGYGSWSDPQSLYQHELDNHLANRGDNIAAMLIPLGQIRPGECHQVITQLGQTDQIPTVLSQVQDFRNPKIVKQAFDIMKQEWDQFLSALQVQTPNEAMNQMLNTFNPYQCAMTANWSRYLSYYQLGYGARGIGFRDNAQDIMGITTNDPQFAKTLLMRLISTQKQDGSAMHQFNPLNMIANEGDSLEMEDRDHFYSDDHLWMILAVTQYLKESGDLSFLEVPLPFYEKDKQEKPIESGTVLEHLRRGLQFTCNNLGSHGLPLLGFADWNDTVNLPKGAESSFTACLFGRAALEMIALYQFLGDQSAAQLITADYEKIKTNFLNHTWDGAWFLRYFDHNGQPIGSHQNQYSQIYTNAQSWAVLAGFAPEEKARQALDSVYEKLNTRFGIKLSTPGFNGYDPNFGGVTTYPPGAKENGGIFLHSNPWVLIAETMLGNGERACQYYDQINPANKNDLIEIFEQEPYVYPQNILGDEHPQFGLARNSWLSGTASWSYQAATQYILGIRPGYQGLTIDPCIPSSWSEFSVNRKLRKSVYQILVHNPDGKNKGIKKMIVDGVQHPLTPIAYFDDGETHQIEVWLGE